jgi:hypothetical protein
MVGEKYILRRPSRISGGGAMPPKDRTRSRKPREGQPQKGMAPPGQSMSPTGLPGESRERAAKKKTTIAAPAPGVPIPADEYGRLKREAEQGPAPNQAPAQEDCSGA